MNIKKTGLLVVTVIILFMLIACSNTTEFIITFDSNGGSKVENISYDGKQKITLPNNPTKEGYTFNGWFNNANFTGDSITEITSDTTDDMTLYAQWTINQYTITYGIFGDDYDASLGIPIYSGEKIIQVSLGLHHSSTLTSEGRIFTWGYNDYGQLGDGTTDVRLTPLEITSQFNLIANEKIVQISLGGYHSSALTSEGRLFTWGSNEYFQLGEDTQIDKSLPLDVTSQFNLTAGEMIIQVSLGFRHSSALTSEGRIFTWGSDKFGQLGDGTATRIYRPLEITSKFSLNESETITKLSLGGNHSSLLTSEGRIFIWGSNEDGQLGDGTQLNQSIPKEITSQFELNESETIIQVFLGGNHSSLFTSEGRIFTWGDNHYYQLGDSTQVNKSIPQEITSQFNLNESETIIQISLGNDHSSLFTSEGRIFTWGHNQYGLNNDTMNRTFRPLEITSHFNLTEGETFIQVSLGGSHSSALTSEGRIFTWGGNGYGGLGNGTQTNEYTPGELYLGALELYSVIIQDYATMINEPVVPIREGYIFDGWYSDIGLTTKYIFTTMSARNMMLYGKWTKD